MKIYDVHRTLFYAAAFISLISQVSAQITPVGIIYRYDMRPPAQVIAEGGFNAWRSILNGGDIDLVSHVEGTSVWTHTTAFVSTSERIEGALRTVGQTAVASLSTYPSTYHSYLYAIRPDPVNTFQVAGSIQNAIEQSTSAVSRELYRTLNAQMNDGIYEIALLGGIPANRIISYADITGELFQTHALASMFAPSFWTTRWVPLTTYNHSYDNDVSSALPYPSSAMREPNGLGFFVGNPEEEDETLPVTMCCFGIQFTPSAYSTPVDCNPELNLKIRYIPYILPWFILLLQKAY